VHELDTRLRHGGRALAVDPSRHAAREHAELLAREPAHRVDVERDVLGDEAELLAVSGGAQLGPELDEPYRAAGHPRRPAPRLERDRRCLGEAVDLAPREPGATRELRDGLRRSRRIDAGGAEEPTVELEERLHLRRPRGRLAGEDRLDHVEWKEAP